MTRWRRERREPDRRFQKVATDFWFAVQRLSRRREGQPPSASEVHPSADDGPDADGGDDGPAASRVPRRPSPSSGSASAAVSSEKADAEQPKPDGRPIALDSTARSADPNLPAFLAPPLGAPAYHGFPILDGVQVDGWRLGLITDTVGSNHTAGDAYLIAPDGRRAGLVWRIEQPTCFIELIGPEPKRFGVFEVAASSGPTSMDGARQFLSEILPAVKEAWGRSTP